MSTIDLILGAKGGEVYTTPAESTVLEALQSMADHDVGALVVLDEGRIVGVFSERDYARKVILQGLSSPRTKVRQVMTDAVYFVEPSQTVDASMALMTEKRVRHLPVLADGDLVGVVSMGDLVRATIADKEFLIGQLEKYIVGH